MDAYYRAVASGKIRQARSRGAGVVVRRFGRRRRSDGESPARAAAGRARRWWAGLRLRRAAARFNENNSIKRSFGGTWFPHSISLQQVPDGLYGVGGSTAGDRRRALDDQARERQDHERRAVLPRDAEGRHRDGDRRRCRGREGRHRRGSNARRRGRAARSRRARPTVEIKTDHRVRLFGIDLENATGAVVDNLGVVSSNVKSFANNARRSLADRARASRRGSDPDHDRRERSRVARPEGPGHQGLSSALREGARDDPQGPARRQRASWCRRPIRPRPRTMATSRGR